VISGGECELGSDGNCACYCTGGKWDIDRAVELALMRTTFVVLLFVSIELLCTEGVDALGLKLIVSVAITSSG
jgi:hypothetical protein